MQSRLVRRQGSTLASWRHSEQQQLPLPVATPKRRATTRGRLEQALKRTNSQPGSSYLLALVITIVIILVQLFIVHHYLGSHKQRQELVVRGRASSENNLLLKNSGWFCHTYPHLNNLAELASKHQVELVIVDRDLLDVLSYDGKRADDANSGAGRAPSNTIAEFNSKTRQEAGHKSIIHLAAINETSGGQPNLVAFHADLKNYYHLVKYDDSSETMAPEVYRRQAHQMDDMQSDALRAAPTGQQLPAAAAENKMRDRMQMHEVPFEISKIYTEFIAHLFLLNTTTGQQRNLKASKLCDRAQNRAQFIVIHLFVLYNYEYRPRDEWIQSSLVMDEIERHKLLAYGVHSIDFCVPLSHNFIHTKRDTSPLSETPGLFGYKLELERPVAQLRVFQPPARRLLTYANNTYLHCKPSAFNISGLIDGNRKLTGHLRRLDASQPPRSDVQRARLAEQLSVAIKFMDVFSKTYGQFSYWLTGSSLLSYHKFCQLTADLSEATGDPDNGADIALDDYDASGRPINRLARDKEITLDLEIGLLSNEVNMSMLSDLSKAKMIGVTMISNWQRSNSRVSFHVRDCPNILFNLNFYEPRQDFYQHFYVINDNMVHKHKFRRKKSVPNKSSKNSAVAGSSLANAENHVFTTRNLDLCWTRVNNVHPFRVPCDVHDHLRRIYVI